MKKIINILVLVLWLMTGLQANDTEYASGYAGAFLRMGLGAENMALGNAGVALTGSSSGAYYNPALIAYNEKISVATGYAFMSLDRKFNYLGINYHLPPTASVSLQWIHAGVDDIQGRTFSGIPDETYSTDEDALMLTFGNRMGENFAFGFTLKTLRHSLLDISGTGVGFDGGIYWSPLKNLAFGAQIKDVTASYTWKTTSIFEEEGSNYIEKFPMVYRTGFMYQYKSFLLVSDMEIIEDNTYFHGGLAYNYKQLGALRIGYDRNSLTFGCGLKYDFLWNTKTELDYAFVQQKYGEGHNHMFTWNFQL